MELKTLCELQGVSGREEPVRAAVYRACVEKLGEKNVAIDKVGNVIASLNPDRKKTTHVMLCAHMDEVGLMVVSAEEDGLLRVRALGGIDPRVLVSKHVTVGYGDKAIPGVIGAMAIHQQTPEDRKAVLPIEQLFVDIGAKNRDDALAAAPQGTPVTFSTPFRTFGDGLCLARALDDRVGVYNLLRLLEDEYPCRVTLAFTCQEEVGCRGATGAAFRVQPDIAVVLEGTTSNDTGDTPETQQVCRVGRGVAVSFMDNSSVAQPELFKRMLALAQEKQIAHQVKMSVSGGNEGGVAQRAASGAKTCVLSVPCRYIHSPNTVCAARDVDAQLALAKAFLQSVK